MSQSQSSCQKIPLKKKNSLFNLTLHNSSSSVLSEENTNENIPTRKFYKSRLSTSTPRKISVIPGKTFDLKFQSDSIKNQKRAKNKKTARKADAPSKKPLQVYQERLKNIIMRNSPKLSGFVCAGGFALSDENFKRGENLDVSVGQSSTTDESNQSKDPEAVQHVDHSCDPAQSSPKTNGENDGIFESSEPSPTPALPEETSTVKEISPNSNKVFPIFMQNSKTSTDAHKRSESKSPPVKKRKTLDEGPHQMILDAGQKQFGASQCPECHMVYCPADPVDKAAHRKFHVHIEEALKFQGWKKERVVQEYPEDSGRVLLILPEDPKYMRKKLEEVNRVMSQELGFLVTNPFTTHSSKIFLYVRDKEICGCCVADPVEQGYRIIPVDHQVTKGQRPWRCSQVPEPASVGISRLWVATSKRKSGIATKLVDCVRQWFNYGTLIPKFKVAFTGPTQDGYQFAAKYIGTNMFLVYK